MKMRSTFIHILSLSLICLSSPAFAQSPSVDIAKNEQKVEQEGIIMFTPPPGWYLADSSLLRKTVKIMVVGKGKGSYPPSINLATQSYGKTLKDYLKTLKASNEAQGNEWKDLGTINTLAGPASLTQSEEKTEWGDVKRMQAIILKNGQIYILMASALKDEFASFYKVFFNAMKSLRVSKDFIEMVSPQRKVILKNAYQGLQDQWKKNLAEAMKEEVNKEKLSAETEGLNNKLFNDENFQTNFWKPYETLINQKFSDMGQEWQSFALEKTKETLFSINPF